METPQNECVTSHRSPPPLVSMRRNVPYAVMTLRMQDSVTSWDTSSVTFRRGTALRLSQLGQSPSVTDTLWDGRLGRPWNDSHLERLRGSTASVTRGTPTSAGVPPSRHRTPAAHQR